MEKTPDYFEQLKDYAHRRQLQQYDDGRWWYLLLDRETILGELAYSAYTGDCSMFETLFQEGLLIIKNTIRDIPGDDFFCIYSEDAYFLEPYNNAKDKKR